MQAQQTALSTSTKWVVKVGSSLLTDLEAGLDHDMMAALVRQIAWLKQNGVDVVLVSSGSIAEGMQRLGWRKRPKELNLLQAAAAVGQMGLVKQYETQFNAVDLCSAQILLTHADLSHRKCYLNARDTLRALLALGVVPIVNENDTVVTEELRGDNDRLGALVAHLVDADVLVLLTDQKGLFDKNPAEHADAQLLTSVNAGDPALIAFAGDGGKLGTGGMRTKVVAADVAAKAGVITVVASGYDTSILQKMRQGDAECTVFVPSQTKVSAKKLWLASQLAVKGQLSLDDGAVRVLQAQGKSLLPIGVTAIEGSFDRGELVTCVNRQGDEIARGLVSYNSDEAQRIIGKSSECIEKELGFVRSHELIHRDNMVLL